MVFTEIPSVPFTSSHLFQNTQSGLSGNIDFVQGFMWYGGHIPPSAPYVGPLPTYVGISSRRSKLFSAFIFQNSIQVSVAPFESSPFSLFSGGIITPVYATPASAKIS